MNKYRYRVSTADMDGRISCELTNHRDIYPVLLLYHNGTCFEKDYGSRTEPGFRPPAVLGGKHCLHLRTAVHADALMTA